MSVFGRCKLGRQALSSPAQYKMLTFVTDIGGVRSFNTVKCVFILLSLLVGLFDSAGKKGKGHGSFDLLENGLPGIFELLAGDRQK